MSPGAKRGPASQPGPAQIAGRQITSDSTTTGRIVHTSRRRYCLSRTNATPATTTPADGPEVFHYAPSGKLRRALANNDYVHAYCGILKRVDHVYSTETLPPDAVICVGCAKIKATIDAENAGVNER